MARWDHDTNFRPGAAPKGYVPGGTDGLHLLRDELHKIVNNHIVRDRFGNPFLAPLPPEEAFSMALGEVKKKRPDLYPGLKDFSESYADPREALAMLIGDPASSDADEWGGPAGEIPFTKD